MSFGLHLISALLFAGLMYLIGIIPYRGGGITTIRLESFGYLAAGLAMLFLFRPGGFLGRFPLPNWPWLGYSSIILISLYCLLVTLPLYFYFRSRSVYWLVAQSVLFGLHCALAQFVVADWWINQ